MGRHEHIPMCFSPHGLRFLVRRGTAGEWAAADPVLRGREVAWESDTDRFKVGDGVSHWAELDYYQKVGGHEDRT